MKAVATGNEVTFENLFLVLVNKPNRRLVRIDIADTDVTHIEVKRLVIRKPRCYQIFDYLMLCIHPYATPT